MREKRRTKDSFSLRKKSFIQFARLSMFSVFSLSLSDDFPMTTSFFTSFSSDHRFLTIQSHDHPDAPSSSSVLHSFFPHPLSSHSSSHQGILHTFILFSSVHPPTVISFLSFIRRKNPSSSQSSSLLLFEGKGSIYLSSLFFYLFFSSQFA